MDVGRVDENSDFHRIVQREFPVTQQPETRRTGTDPTPR